MATAFLGLCEAHRLPVVSLVDTPGFMVGPAAERTAIVRRFGALFVAGAPAHRAGLRGGAAQGLDAVSFVGVRLRSRKRPGLDKLARGRLIGGTGAE